VELLVLLYFHEIKLENGVENHNFQVKSFIMDGDLVAENKLQSIFGKY
jgi:hypothetical protein